MANCTNCGKKISEGVKFCPSCGTAVSSKKASARGSRSSAKSGSKDAAPKASSKDAEDNKGMAIIAYIGILFLIPLLTGDYKKSPFLKFHTNQGLILCIFAVAVWIVWSIIWAIIAASLRSSISAILAYYRFIQIAGVIAPLLWIGILVLCVLGILNVVNGRMKPLPVIGRFQFIK